MIYITNEKDINIDMPLQALYFYANWMPFNKKYLTMIEKVETKYNILFNAIDVDYFSNQCKRFSITSIPTVLVMKNGKEINRITGLVLTSAFNSIFANIYKEKKNDRKE